jgi:diguanylate cyclase (GGDEF)-like protein/PAS domain S-box-containing protein
MKDKNKDKEFFNGKKFFEGIKFWQKQILELVNLRSTLKRSKAELKKFPQKLRNQVEIRTAAERMVNKQLHHEIEQRKETEQVLQDALEYSRGIVDTVREPLLVLDTDLRVISANRSFYRSFKVRPEYTEKQHIYALGNRQWNIPKLRELLEDILPKTTSFDNFEVEHNFPDVGKRIMLLNARKIYRKANHTQLILLAIEDITERKKSEEKLKTLASHDELTGCVNFRSTMELLESEIARSSRYQKKFSIIMLDLDHFKGINDEYGHLAGNDALVAFANVVKNNVRNIDTVGRYGGEEFIIVLPETDPQDALVFLERIRDNLEQTKITSPHLKNVKEFTLKFSAGIVAFPYNAGDLKELIWVADSALRQAKQKGKNRAVLERRRLIRLNPIPDTRIEIVDSSGKENVKALKIANISKEGMLFLSTQDIPGEEFLCRIYRPKDESPFELTCRVRHKGKSNNEFYRLGVYFPDISESSKEKLSQCAESPK